MYYKHYINGSHTGAGPTFKSINPSNGSILGEFLSGSEKDVDHAVSSAKSSLDKWRNTPPPVRAQILFKAAQILKRKRPEFGKLVSQEMGKVLKEGLGDVQEAIDMLEYAAGEGRRLFGHTTTSELPDKFAMTVREPVGVIGMITPWNFPIAIPSWKIAPALVCGNTIVFKPASDTPLCAHRFAGVLAEAGLPPGVLNVVTGSGSAVGTPLVKHSDVDAISFTGSREVGAFIAQEAGKDIKHVGLELGGKNAIIINKDADLNLALDGVIWGAFGTSGQRCTACSRLIIHERVEKKFTKALKQRTEHLKLGDPLKKTTDVGPVVNESQLKKIHNYIQIGKEEGAKLITGGSRAGGALAKGTFYKPTIFTNVTPDMRIAREEIFGPVLSVISVTTLDEAIEINNSVDYGLVAAIYTKNVNKAFEAMRALDTGLVYINSSTIGSEVHLPFGGTKHTGNGVREAGILGIDEFSEIKTVYVDYSGKLQKAQGID